jgi:RNA polymerase sigma-70 factor, ECF subfamily
MQDFTDEQLVGIYIKGDEKALEILISRHLKSLYNFVYGYVGNKQEAEDVVQETFVKIWRSIKKFDKKKKFKTWIFRIARNTAIDFLRKKKDISFSNFEGEDGNNPIIDTIADPEPLPDELFDRQDLGAAFARVLETLSVKYRTVLLMYYQEGLNFQEISEYLEEPVNTIKSRHRRALIQLRQVILDAPNIEFNP